MFRSAVRSFAAAASPKVVVPVQLQSLSGKYATAAFTGALSQSEQTLKQVETDLQAIHKLIEANDKSVVFFGNPTLTANDREASIKAVVSKLPKASEITSNLLNVLSSNARLPLTPAVLADFFTLTSAHSGLLTVTVTSSAPLESATLQRIEKALKASEQAKGKTLKVENKVNESILGGLIIDFGDKTVDLSAASRVNKLNALLNASA